MSAPKDRYADDWSAVVRHTMSLENFVEKHYEYLYELFLPQMPYGTAKARTGDPMKFIFDRLERRI